MHMYTVDASVHVSALNRGEGASTESRSFLAEVHQQQVPLVNPTLLPVEVAAAVTRALGDADLGVSLAAALCDLPNQRLVPLDDALSERAVELAAAARLRGSDAVYAAVAQQNGTTLVTLDRQQLERLTSVVPTARPVDVLPGERQPG
jgi:predicted nucleic acid-binding protein